MAWAAMGRESRESWWAVGWARRKHAHRFKRICSIACPWARRKSAFCRSCGMPLRDAGEEGLFRRVDGVRGSHMHPHAIQPQAEEPFLLVGAIEHFRQRKFTRGGIDEQGWRHDRSACVDERNDLMFPALAQRAIRQHRVTAASAITDAPRRG